MRRPDSPPGADSHHPGADDPTPAGTGRPARERPALRPGRWPGIALGTGRTGPAKRALLLGALPAGVYLVLFVLYTWPWMPHFSSEFFTDTGDGYQNVWNMWWVNHAVTVLHQLPWHTDDLHYPSGTTLLGQTMNPFNGFVAIGLLPFLTLVQAFNAMVVFSFVATGVTGFWLCRYFARRYVASLIGGALITFSGYHLAKTLGLMQLVSLEWVPLFLLLWWRLLVEPTRRRAAGAALVLGLVVYCDYYYFLFACVAACTVFVHLRRQHMLRLDRAAGTAFVAVAGVFAAPLPVALVVSNLFDPMSGGHPSSGTDIFSIFIDGGNWRFDFLTAWYYGPGRAGAVESTVYLTVTVTVLLAIAVAGRRRFGPANRFWVLFTAVTMVLALGPDLVVHRRNTGIPMPFDLLRLALPVLEYNIEPDRIIVMATISSAVVASVVLSHLDLAQARGVAVTGLVAAAVVFELWPATPPSAPVSRPGYVAFIATLPPGGVIDDGAAADGTVDKSLQLYDAVLDGHPLAFGYISRTPASVSDADARLRELIDRKDYPALCRDGFRYATTPTDHPWPGRRRVLYDQGGTTVYALCAPVS